jgi:hypothetical protein
VSTTCGPTTCAPGDDTCWIQKLLDTQATVRLPAGIFHITHLELHSGQRLIMTPGTILRPVPAPLQVNRLMLWANAVDDIVIEGGVIDGVGSARSTGIGLTGVSRARIRGTHCINMVEDSGFRGDGIYINKSLGGTRCARPIGKLCEDIVLEDVTFERNMRQGLMVASVCGLRLRNCSILDTTGAATGAGIDIEPNVPTDVVEGVDIDGCTITGNNYGILFQPSGTEGSVAVSVRNSTISNNRNIGVSMTRPDMGPRDRYSVIIKGNTIAGNAAQGVSLTHLHGGIRVTDNVIRDNRGHGVLVDLCDRWAVTGNTIVGNGERGISVTTRASSPGEFGQIVDNHIWDNGQAPYYPTGGPGVVLSSALEPRVFMGTNSFGSDTRRQTSALLTYGPHQTVRLADNMTIDMTEAVHK